MVVRSHYPAIDLQAIGAGFAKGMGEVEHQQLEDEVEDVAKKLASDIDLLARRTVMAKTDNLLGEHAIISE